MTSGFETDYWIEMQYHLFQNFCDTAELPEFINEIMQETNTEDEWDGRIQKCGSAAAQCGSKTPFLFVMRS